MAVPAAESLASLLYQTVIRLKGLSLCPGNGPSLDKAPPGLDQILLRGTRPGELRRGESATAGAIGFQDALTPV